MQKNRSSFKRKNARLVCRTCLCWYLCLCLMMSTLVFWETGVDATSSVIIYIAKHRGARRQAGRSVPSHPQSSAVCSQWLSPALAACLHGEIQDLHPSCANWKSARQKEKNPCCLCFIMYWPLYQERGDDGKDEGDACHVGINVQVCVYGWGGGSFLPLHELIQAICSASRGERCLIAIVCCTLTMRHTHNPGLCQAYLPLSV